MLSPGLLVTGGEDRITPNLTSTVAPAVNDSDEATH